MQKLFCDIFFFPDIIIIIIIIIILASTFSKQTTSLGHVWTAALGLLLESKLFIIIIIILTLLGEERKMWIYSSKNGSEMLNVSLKATTLTYMFIQ